jgi:hypothetical protein
VSARVKTALLHAYRSSHPGAPARRLVPGSTYYGTSYGIEFAVVRVELDGRVSDPVVLSTETGRWEWKRDTHGGVCWSVVPGDLISLWGFAPLPEPDGRGGECFRVPEA